MQREYRARGDKLAKKDSEIKRLDDINLSLSIEIGKLRAKKLSLKEELKEKEKEVHTLKVQVKKSEKIPLTREAVVQRTKQGVQALKDLEAKETEVKEYDLKYNSAMLAYQQVKEDHGKKRSLSSRYTIWYRFIKKIGHQIPEVDDKTNQPITRQRFIKCCKTTAKSKQRKLRKELEEQKSKVQELGLE